MSNNGISVFVGHLTEPVFPFGTLGVPDPPNQREKLSININENKFVPISVVWVPQSNFTQEMCETYKSLKLSNFNSGYSVKK